ncbi:beta-1,3-galactosyltransferase 5-like [Limulus polyphemus]|uniref:Hexosyltransferase n=1 Tax=Limulus polyphemus TaxID=6850 RepID=A0ABM1BU45_LIMPO|nr:beta-1,3-galactosyltransferase 5-like [Limulus polyphemus]
MVQNLKDTLRNVRGRWVKTSCLFLWLSAVGWLLFTFTRTIKLQEFQNLPNTVEYTIELKKYQSIAHFPRGVLSLPGPRELLHLKDFKFYNSKLNVCKSKNSLVLALVHTAPNHFVHRKIIRSTWGSVHHFRNLTFNVAFLLGQTNRRLQSRINQEMKQHCDIIQGSFVDSYRNLSYKHMMGYKWAMEFCPNAIMIFKVDDDVYVDSFQILNFLYSTFGLKPFNILACSVISSGTLTHRSGKWGVSRSEFSFDMYPEYCSGMGYFVSLDIVKDILAASRYAPFFWIDDIFVTGLVAEVLNLNRLPINAHTSDRPEEMTKWLRQGKGPSPYMLGLISPHNGMEILAALWNKTTIRANNYTGNLYIKNNPKYLC